MSNKGFMQFEITDDKLKMEIRISDLIHLFHNHPGNYCGVDKSYAKVKGGKEREFAEYVVEQLQDWKDDSNPVWGQPFEDIFIDIIKSAEDQFIEYSDFD